MAWSFVAVGTSVEVTATGHTLTEPAGVQPGDLLVAVISSRIASTTSITLPSGWTRVAESKTNNVVAAATTSEASGMMAYIIRGDSAPALTFTHPVAPSVAVGRIVAYRGGDFNAPFDVGIGAKTSTNVTAVSTTGLTAAAANELIVKGFCSGFATSTTAHNAATSPNTSSGSNSVQTAAPIVGTWQERQDANTATGADTTLAIADAVKAASGATGNLTCTAANASGHAQVAGAFKMETAATAGSSTITQTGSNLDFTNATANAGTVSSTITVPSDAQIVVVGLQGWVSDASYFTNMTFTKGGSDTAMTRVGPTEPGNSQRVVMFYLVLPDTGANKSLKYDWAGTNVPGETPMISVTFWKGIDTASPVRSSGASIARVVSSSVPCRTPLLTAQNGDLVVGFVGGDCGSNAEKVVSTFYNLNLVAQCTNANAIRHDGAWGSFAPSGNLYVGGETGTIAYGACAAIVLAPSVPVTGTLTETEDPDVAAMSGAVTDRITQVGSLLEFRPGSGANAGTVSTTITVPAGTDFITVGVSTFRAEVGYVTGGSMTFTKGGVDTAMTVASNLSDTNTSGFMGAMFYMASPDVGSNKTLKWDWQGSAVADFSFHHIFSITFWSGVEVAAPVRSASGVNVAAAPPWNTGTLTAQAADKIIAYAHAYANAVDGSVTAWNNLTELSEITWDNPSDGAWATSLPTGNTTVGVQSAANWDDGGISAIVVKPFTGATGVTGTLATTEAADVAAMVGTREWIATLAASETRDTVAFNGNVAWIVTLAASEARDTVVFNGTVQWPATLAASEARDTVAFLGGTFGTGTLGTTEAADVAALSGSVAWIATLVASESSDVAALSGVTAWVATLAATEAKDTAAATGTVQWAVALAATEAPDVAAFTGAIFNPVTGTLAVSEAPDIAALAGGIYGTGTLGTTEAADVAAMVGSVSWLGTLAATEAKDSASLAGTVQWLATLIATEAPDVAGLAGAVAWAGTIAASEARDVAALTGGTFGTGTLAASEAPDLVELDGTVFDQGGGALFAHEAPDVAALAGAVSGRAGTLGASEAPDVAALAGQTAWAAVLAATEAKDTGAGLGTVGWSITLAASEAPDVVSIAGGTYGTGTLAASEAPDVALFASGTFGSGVLTATETPDTAALTGTLTTVGGGTLTATEPADVAQIAAAAFWAGALAASEAPDVAIFTGATEAKGTLAASESTDQADVFGLVLNPPLFGTLEATEKPDVARFTTRPPDIQQAPGYILRRGDPRVRLLLSSDQRVRSLKYPMPRPRELVNQSDTRARDFAGRRARSLVKG